MIKNIIIIKLVFFYIFAVSAIRDHGKTYFLTKKNSEDEESPEALLDNLIEKGVADLNDALHEKSYLKELNDMNLNSLYAINDEINMDAAALVNPYLNSTAMRNVEFNRNYEAALKFYINKEKAKRNPQYPLAM